jgi:hypothetical protein
MTALAQPEGVDSYGRQKAVRAVVTFTHDEWFALERRAGGLGLTPERTAKIIIRHHLLSTPDRKPSHP